MKINRSNLQIRQRSEFCAPAPNGAIAELESVDQLGHDIVRVRAATVAAAAVARRVCIAAAAARLRDARHCSSGGGRGREERFVVAAIGVRRSVHGGARANEEASRRADWIGTLHRFGRQK